MNLSDWTTLVSSLGFPAFVAIYFMIVNSKLTKDNTNAIYKMKDSIDRLTECIERNK